MSDLDGDPPRWAHTFDDDLIVAGPADRVRTTVADLGCTDLTGHAGVVWSLPHGGDVDVNLVHLDPNGAIDAHVNHEVDVVISVIAGQGHLVIDGTAHPLRDLVLAFVPKGEPREIRAGVAGITYLSIHRRRAPLGISTRPPTQVGRE
ncbi:MAG: cupin domain-containing protein [Ilumatobacteraceae bacterium]